MTKLQALQSVVSDSVDPMILEKALIDAGITASDAYEAADKEPIDKAAIPVLQGLLSSANVSEGGFSKSYDRDAIQVRLTQLCKKYGIKDETNVPIIKGSKPW